MTHARSWRLFRRMQLTLLAAAALTYAATALEAWSVPGAGLSLKLARTALFPAGFLILSVGAVLFVPVLSRAMTSHLWASYRTGFGQSVISVLVGVGIILGLAGVILWQVRGAAHGGRYPAGAFSGYAAGLGLLIAQAVLLRRIETDPTLGRLIEE